MTNIQIKKNEVLYVIDPWIWILIVKTITRFRLERYGHSTVVPLS
jgi:hypothetical protein